MEKPYESKERSEPIDIRVILELASRTLVGHWLMKQPLWNFNAHERNCIVATVIGAHFTGPARIQLKIKTDTINAFVDQFHMAEHADQEMLEYLRDGKQDILQYLIQETPKRHLSAHSPRRKWFLEAKHELLHDMREAVIAERIAEMLYLTIAILEDREERGSSAVM